MRGLVLIIFLCSLPARALEIKVPLVKHDPKIRALAEEPAILFLALQNAGAMVSNPALVEWKSPRELKLLRQPSVPISFFSLRTLEKVRNEISYEVAIGWHLWADKTIRFPVRVRIDEREVSVDAKELNFPLPFGLTERIHSAALRLFSAENQSRVRDYLERKSKQVGKRDLGEAIRAEWSLKNAPRPSRPAPPVPFPFEAGLTVLLFAWTLLLIHSWRRRLRSKNWRMLFEEMRI